MKTWKQITSVKTYGLSHSPKMCILYSVGHIKCFTIAHFSIVKNKNAKKKYYFLTHYHSIATLPGFA